MTLARHFVDEFGAEGLVSDAIFVGQDRDVAGETVFDGVETDGLAACGTAGSGGFFCVAAIGCELLFGDRFGAGHRGLLSLRSSMPVKGFRGVFL